MTELTIRKTEINDLPRLREIFDYARGVMTANGNPNQWAGYPRAGMLERDIERGVSYVMLNDKGTVCATFVFALGPDKMYERQAVEDGDWLNHEPYGVIHRIASDGTVPGIVECAVDFAAERTKNLRIDTGEKNTIMQHVLEKLGFTRCGRIYSTMPVDPERIAYQKIFS